VKNARIVTPAMRAAGSGATKFSQG
jgi:hypothetical protein